MFLKKWLASPFPKADNSDNKTQHSENTINTDQDFLKTSENKLDEDSISSGVDSAYAVEEIQRIDFLNLLPYEISLNIVQYLPPVPSYTTLGGVSKQWNQIVNDNTVWRAWFIATFPIPISQKLHEPEYYCPISRQPQNDKETTIKTEKPPAASNFNHNLARDWKKLYRQKMILNSNWLKGKYTTHTILGHTDAVYCIQFDHQRIVSGSRDKTIKYWRLSDLKCTNKLTGHTGSVLCLQYNSKYLVSGSSDTLCIIWDFETGTRLRTLKGHSSAVLDVRINDQYVVSCSKDCTIKVWDIVTGSLLRTLDGHGAAVNAIYLYNSIIASASGDSIIKLWNIHTGQLLRDYNGHSRGLACIQFDGEEIVSGSNDHTIRVWNAKTGECTRVIEAHEKLVRTLCFDSQWIVSGSYDETVKVFDRESGKQILDLTSVHNSWIFHVQMSSYRIVSASQDQRIVIWDFTQGVDSVYELAEIMNEIPS